ncbi:MAG: hypothetical protein IJQ73_10910 [Kiritimatiellae bacterium]|nr:hypothetical protein [Kiritimatiellia bacterium]
MKISKSVALALCAAGAMATSGCLTNTTGTMQDTTKPVLQSKYTVLGDRVSGVDSQWILPFGIRQQLPGSAALRALDKAKGKVPGTDALVEASQNVEIYQYWPLPPVIKVDTRVSGIPVKIDSLK